MGLSLKSCNLGKRGTEGLYQAETLDWFPTVQFPNFPNQKSGLVTQQRVFAPLPSAGGNLRHVVSILKAENFSEPCDVL